MIINYNKSYCFLISGVIFKLAGNAIYCRPL